MDHHEAQQTEPVRPERQQDSRLLLEYASNANTRVALAPEILFMTIDAQTEGDKLHARSVFSKLVKLSTSKSHNFTGWAKIWDKFETINITHENL